MEKFRNGKTHGLRTRTGLKAAYVTVSDPYDCGECQLDRGSKFQICSRDFYDGMGRKEVFKMTREC
ncbi:MAG: hypothetical protein NTZ74_02080 [Chloroflexi bacterium]|nr:hypothetical protein [Chloroflexota bacterium]